MIIPGGVSLRVIFIITIVADLRCLEYILQCLIENNSKSDKDHLMWLLLQVYYFVAYQW